MFINYLLLIVGFYSTLVTAQYSGEACIVERSQLPGTCKAILDCPAVLADIQKRRKHTRCGFEGTTEITCCPNPQEPTTTTKPPEIDENSRISARKCKEYSKAMYEYVFSLSLSIGATRKPTEIDRCGHKVVPLIVGGEFAKPREFPHMALVGFDLGNNVVSWGCGGTLISEQHVITAGHCLFSRTLGAPKYIRLGELNILTEEDDAQPEDFNVTRIIPHPNYTKKSKYNDIGILVMDRKVKLNPYHRPACLPQSFDGPERQAIATGWGHTKWAGEGSQHLLKVTLEKFSHQECNSSYRYEIGNKLRYGIVDQTQLCAGSKNAEKDTCQGDSGGPLQVFHPYLYCMYDIIGVTSFGILCGEKNVPGIYTRVYPYLDWIEREVWG